MTTTYTDPSLLPSHEYCFQRVDSILTLIPAGGRFVSEASIILVHKQLVKGIPSFKLNDEESIIAFVDGFLWRIASKYHNRYSEILWSVFEMTPGIPILFGASVPDRHKHLVFQPQHSSTEIKRIK